MSEFIPDLRQDARGKRLLDRHDGDIEEVEILLGVTDPPACITNRWFFHLRRVLERMQDGPSEVYIHENCELNWFDGMHIACVRAALNVPIPTIVYTLEEALEWKPQR